jgi:hypothetical protein
MSPRKRRSSTFAAIQMSLLALFMCSAAQAQTPEQLLRAMRDAARQQGQATSGKSVTAADLIGGAPAATGQGAAVLWPNRQAFLAATQAGELASFHSASEPERDRVVASIQRILNNEYRVPAISRECFRTGGFYGDIVALLSDIAQANTITLSDQGPDFINASANRDYYTESIERRLARMQSTRDRTHCDGESMGRVVPHPYKAALVSLASDYSKATQAYVEGERNRRQVAYRETAARHQQEQQQEQQQRQSAARAIEQQRIDAEAARVRADEQRRAQQEKNRIGG